MSYGSRLKDNEQDEQTRLPLTAIARRLATTFHPWSVGLAMNRRRQLRSAAGDTTHIGISTDVEHPGETYLAQCGLLEP